jgi:hypothetical protein
MRGDPKRLIFYCAILGYRDEVNNIPQKKKKNQLVNDKEPCLSEYRN